MAIFHMRGTPHDIEGYYHPRWDLATPIEVEADDKQAAVNEAARILGDCRPGYYWGFRVDRIAASPQRTEGGA